MKKILSVLLGVIMTISCMSGLGISAKAKKVVVNAPTMSAVTVPDINQLKVSWSKSAGAKGYQLYYSTNGKKWKKLTTTTKRSYTHKKLEENTKYYYKVRAYKVVKGSKKYSKYSNIVTRRSSRYLMDMMSPYASNYCTEYRSWSNSDKFYMGGKGYTNGFTLGGSTWYSEFAIFNLKEKYSSITFTFGPVDDKNRSNTLELYSDDELIQSYNIDANDLPKTVTIDTKNANKFEFRMRDQHANDYFGFANIKLNK